MVRHIVTLLFIFEGTCPLLLLAIKRTISTANRIHLGIQLKTNYYLNVLWPLPKRCIIFDLLYDQHYWTANNLDASFDQLVSEAILNTGLEPLAEHVDVHLDKIYENLNFNELPVSTLCTSISSSCLSSTTLSLAMLASSNCVI